MVFNTARITAGLLVGLFLTLSGLSTQAQNPPIPAVIQASTLPSVNDGGHLGRAATLSNLPVAAQGSISAAVGRDDSRYWVHAAAVGFHAENIQHGLAVDFGDRGVEVRSDTLRWLLVLSGYGYGNTLLPLKESAPHAEANRVEYGRGPLTEWYANGPGGLEQGFTLTQPPGQANGPVTVSLAL